MLDEIHFDNLEGADDKFASLQSEHINSPLVKEAMLILAHAHMEKQEYILAGFYFDEYLKRYGTTQNQPFVAFMKLQANYYAFSKENVNQQLLLDTIQECKDYMKLYPESHYKEFVNTLLIELYLAYRILNKDIMRVYDMRDAQEAVKIYHNKTPDWIQAIPTKPFSIPWYRKIFDW